MYLLRGANLGVSRRWHARCDEDLLAESLGALESRPIGSRANHGDTVRAERVGHTCDQRRLGSHDHETDPVFAARSVDLVRRDRGDREVSHTLKGSGARVSRRDVHAGYERTRGDLPREGVFAATSAEDEDMEGRHGA